MGGDLLEQGGVLHTEGAEKEKGKKIKKSADRLLQRIGESRLFQTSTAAALFDRGGELKSAALVKMLSINETRSRGRRNGDQDVEMDTSNIRDTLCKDTSRADVSSESLISLATALP
jgi:hypothetical protein